MPIQFFEDQRILCLHGPRFTYAFQVRPGDELAHLYWGTRLADRQNAGERLAGLIYPEEDHSFSALPAGDISTLSVDDRTLCPGLQAVEPAGKACGR